MRAYLPEDTLCLAVAPGFYTRWAAQQLNGWQAWLQEVLQLPDSCFVRSGLSVSRKEGQASAGTGAASLQASLPELSMAMCAVLGLCA
eukprot:1020077-Lingulodinium_polyedra.AAC.1